MSAAGDDADVQVVHEEQDGCAGVAATETDVVEPAVVPQGQLAVRVDLVAADGEVAVDQRDAGRDGLGPGGVGLGGGAPAHGAVQSDGVVVAAEGVELGL